MFSVLSKRFIDTFDSGERNKVSSVEIENDVELEKKFSKCLESGHHVFKHSDHRSMSYGHVCKTCGKYFHRHISMTGRGSSVGVMR